MLRTEKWFCQCTNVLTSVLMYLPPVYWCTDQCTGVLMYCVQIVTTYSAQVSCVLTATRCTRSGGRRCVMSGAAFLQFMGLDGPEVFVLFIMMCAMINLSLGSASAQWAVTAPIFVPMLMLIGFAPEVIQAAYRIGDTVSNIITPMMSYFGLILAIASRYQKNLGMGTLIAMMLPYSMIFFVAWTILFYIWVFLIGLPVGPGAETYYNP